MACLRIVMTSFLFLVFVQNVQGIEFPGPDDCQYESKIYKDGAVISGADDICKGCSCSSGEIVCYRTICKSLTCPEKEQYVPKNKCCKACKQKPPGWVP